MTAKTPMKPGDKRAQKQKRVASALRENLKRRKAAPRPKKPEPAADNHQKAGI